jgi:hypothetical protein
MKNVEGIMAWTKMMVLVLINGLCDIVLFMGKGLGSGAEVTHEVVG